MTDHRLRLAATIVALAGMGVSGYLTWTHFAGSSPSLCVTGGGCETVQESSYSEIAGIPVALLGLLAYAAILALVWSTQALAPLAAATLAFFGLLFSVFLLVVQLTVIDAVCSWCVVNDVLIAPLLAIVTALRLRAAYATASGDLG